MNSLPKDYLINLRQILTERFDESELRTLCFDLGIDYDDLPGSGKVDKARDRRVILQRLAGAHRYARHRRFGHVSSHARFLRDQLIDPAQ
jgi:hypothetical protein